MTVLPYSGCAPAKKTVPPAGARPGVRGWGLMSRPLLDSAARDHAAIERVDRLALLGDLPGEGPGFASQLAQLHPVSGEGADHGEGEGDPGERAPRDRSREVEPDHPGTVAPDNQQTELIAALHACPRPRRLRSGRSSGLRSFLDQTVNRTLLKPHAGRPTANAVPGGMGTHNQAVGAHGLPFRQPSGKFRVTIMTRCIGP